MMMMMIIIIINTLQHWTLFNYSGNCVHIFSAKLWRWQLVVDGD